MIEHVIVALNEESNIKQCIDSIKSFEGAKLTLLDGGSTDRTRDIARECGCHVVCLPDTSISYRRGYAIANATEQYVCFVDADQRLINSSADGVETIKQYFEENPLLAGVQYALLVDNPDKTYWVKGFAKRLELITGKAGARKVIGTPCIFRVSHARTVGYEENLTGPSDDTLFCSRLINNGFQLIAISQSAVEVVRSSLHKTIKKAYWYGRGDAEYIRYDTKNRTRHLYHVLVRGPVIYPLSLGFRNISLVPFFIIFGLSRVMGLISGIVTKEDLTKTSS